MEDGLKRFEKLEAELVEMKFELERAKAINECQNLMSLYVFYLKANKFDECAKLWARRDDSRVEMAWGIYDGYEGISKCYNGCHGERFGKDLGTLNIHTLTTSVIEVAADGKTARATWISPGVETHLKDGEPQCSWCWIKYGSDFIKENGKWYLWHMSTFGTFMCDYHNSWGEETRKPRSVEIDIFKIYPPHWLPNREITHGDWQYTADGYPELAPVPPLPYKTWDEVGYGY